MSGDRYAYVCDGCVPPCICVCRDKTEFGCTDRGECRRISATKAAKIVRAFVVEQQRGGA